jgi:hypothetical protein
MPIEPAQLARSLGALGSLDVERGLAVTLPQVLRSAKSLLDADRIALMLIDQAGALGWASASDRARDTLAGDVGVPVQVDRRLRCREGNHGAHPLGRGKSMAENGSGRGF